MNEGMAEALRAGLEAWELEAGAQWEAWIRSPSVLRRVGEQLRQALEAQLRVRESLESVRPGYLSRRSQLAKLLCDLERLEKQAELLGARLDELERILNHD